VRRENLQATKPPPATRHRAVMSLRQAIPLYDMRSHSSTSLQAILQSSRHAEKVMMVATVSTNRLSRIPESPTYVELGITFYPGDTGRDDENRPPKLDLKVIMPEGWTPKMYVAALNKSIRRRSIICLESIVIEGRIYATVNELQWLFSASDEATHSQLTCSASYIRVSGGVLK
jgi:hypothetical protein